MEEETWLVELVEVQPLRPQHKGGLHEPTRQRQWESNGQEQMYNTSCYIHCIPIVFSFFLFYS